MFDFLKKKPAGKTVTLSISGLHCTSCSLNIDGALEDTPGVLSANTSYAQSKTVVTYAPERVSPERLKAVIEALEYTVTEITYPKQ